MIRRLLIVLAFVAGVMAGAPALLSADTKAERWTMGMELIHDWSLFHCSPTVGERLWTFTLAGTELRGEGPGGLSWTTKVAADGAFKVEYTGRYQDLAIPVEMSGNVRTRRIEIYDKKYDCWYRLTPASPY